MASVSVCVSIIFHRRLTLHYRLSARPGPVPAATGCCVTTVVSGDWGSEDVSVRALLRETSDYWHLSCYYCTTDKIIHSVALSETGFSSEKSSGISSYFSLTSRVQFTFINKDIKISSRRYLSIFSFKYICFVNRGLAVSFPWEFRCVLERLGLHWTVVFQA